MSLWPIHAAIAAINAHNAHNFVLFEMRRSTITGTIGD
jgi:hypothetical protein